MAKQTSPSDSDQHDPKIFRESLGSFGTTTKPGGNQLQELQAKVRQGVKHVELHLASVGKGQFNVQDVPDKYGFEQRRTIMQLAKMNEQTLSVHGTFDVTSFSGIGQSGFDEATRLNSIKEIDETLKFAAETAKGGAVVFHIQGDPISTDRGELNLSKEYLDWLKEHKEDEYDKIKAEYFDENYLKRRFVNNPENEKEVRENFEKLKLKDSDKYNDYLSKAKSGDREAWEYFYIDSYLLRQKLSPERSPLIMVGDKIAQTQREQEVLNVDIFRKADYLKANEKEILKKIDVNLDDPLIDDFQRAYSIFSNGYTPELEGKISREQFYELKKKVIVDYRNVLQENMNMQSQADKEYHKKLLDFQIEQYKLQGKDFDINYAVYKDYYAEIRDIERTEKRITSEIAEAEKNNDAQRVAKLKSELKGGLIGKEQEDFNKLFQKYRSNQGKDLTPEEMNRLQELDQKRSEGLQQKKLRIMQQEVGQVEYQKLERYFESKAQINEKIRELTEQRDNVKALTDVSFEKNTSAMAHLGIKALRYQLDLKQKAKVGAEKIAGYNKRQAELEKKYLDASGSEKEKVHDELRKLKYEMRTWVGTKDYTDIDLINRPLYLAPENMLPGYGSLTSLEEYKAVIRMTQEEFTKKILGNEPEYKKLREEYEKETGLKIKTHDDAIKLAKRHIGGTFDNAHAAVWLKHFKRENGESEEHRIDRFNKWLNQQAEDMAREGIIKHIHFNDTQAKDDDHNLLGSGILDLHDMRERLRRAGIKEPLIVEAGGRGADRIMHVMNAFEIFNPSLFKDIPGGYKMQGTQAVSGSGVSDWISVRREYDRRPETSQYGMHYSTFRHVPPGQNLPKGTWSGTGFL